MVSSVDETMDETVGYFHPDCTMDESSFILSSVIEKWMEVKKLHVYP
jgi:hypothetical protein